MDSVAESPISTRRSATDNAFIVPVDDGEHVTESWVNTLWRWWNERVINARLVFCFYFLFVLFFLRHITTRRSVSLSLLRDLHES